MDSPTFDWKYLVCPKGQPAWNEFASESATWATQPFSNRDFDCTRVAEAIATYLGPKDAVTLCLEDRFGNRHEVDVEPQVSTHYETLEYRDLGKVQVQV